MLSRAGITGIEARRRPIRIRTGFRGNDADHESTVILDKFFGPPGRGVKAIR